MVWSSFLQNMYEWVLDIINAVGDLWDWLTTDIDILGLVNIKPLYLVGVAGLVAGVIKAIVA